MTTTQADVALESALREIAASSLAANCAHCWSAPGDSCTTALSGGTHIARIARAARKGLITSADLSLVLDTLNAFSGATVLYEARGAVAA